MNSYKDLRAEILLDPACSYWIKEAAVMLEARDPCDAIRDLELLIQLSEARLKEIGG